VGCVKRCFRFARNPTLNFGPSRDRDGRATVGIMRSAVREALVAEREKVALGQRREQARTRATILAGTDTCEHETRLPQRTIRLAESEA
jgi:hypothetical protein